MLLLVSGSERDLGLDKKTGAGLVVGGGIAGRQSALDCANAGFKVYLAEGLDIGVVFGALGTGSPDVTLAMAVALTIGLGIQNLPEGMAIAFPLCRDGLSRWKSFWYGQLMAVVEPLGAVVGVIAVTQMHSILPYASGFAAGAMMFVVIEELIPESQQCEHPDIATIGTMIGFVGMMILDVGLS